MTTWRYSAWEIVGIVVFVAFCIGMVSIMLGLLTIVAAIFLVNSKLTDIGTTSLFYGLAVIFVCAGIGCFIPEKDKVLVQ